MHFYTTNAISVIQNHHLLGDLDPLRPWGQLGTQTSSGVKKIP